MAYKVELSKRFQKSLRKIPNESAKRILKTLKDIGDSEDDPRSQGKPLVGHLRGLWRYRVGDYRIICDIYDDELVVIVLDVGHRREIYKHHK